MYRMRYISVAWKVLSFWQCYYRVSVGGEIHWHAGPW